MHRRFALALFGAGTTPNIKMPGAAIFDGMRQTDYVNALFLAALGANDFYFDPFRWQHFTFARIKNGRSQRRLKCSQWRTG